MHIMKYHIFKPSPAKRGRRVIAVVVSVCLSVCVSVCLRHYSKTAGSYDFLPSEIAFLHTRKNLGYVL